MAVVTLVSTVLGLLVFKWEWLSQLFGIHITVERGHSIITVEYVWGMLAVFLLGYLFSDAPIVAAVAFLAGPTVISHLAHIWAHGVPRLWPLELMFLAVLTVPYVGIALAAAFLRKKLKPSTTTMQ